MFQSYVCVYLTKDEWTHNFLNVAIFCCLVVYVQASIVFDISVNPFTVNIKSLALQNNHHYQVFYQLARAIMLLYNI